jgi:hypothetical protein
MRSANLTLNGVLIVCSSSRIDDGPGARPAQNLAKAAGFLIFLRSGLHWCHALAYSRFKNRNIVRRLPGEVNIIVLHPAFTSTRKAWETRTTHLSMPVC